MFGPAIGIATGEPVWRRRRRQGAQRSLHRVTADGWRATHREPAALAAIDPQAPSSRVAVLRAGFDSAGVAVTRTEMRTITSRVRRPWPD